MKFLYYTLFVVCCSVISLNAQQRPVFPVYSENSTTATPQKPIAQENKKRLSFRQRRLDPKRQRISRARLRKAFKWIGFIFAGAATVALIGFGGFVAGMMIVFA